jgi:hypothetical protein
MRSYNFVFVVMTDFECEDAFVAFNADSDRNVVTKMTYCVRAYKKYGGLYDALYFGITVHNNSSALISHFTLAGVESDIAQRFTRKFIAGITWK